MAEKPLQSSRDVIRNRITVASKLLRCCVENGQVVGIQRYSRRLRAEKEFLESVRCVLNPACIINAVAKLLDNDVNIKEQHLISTNLLYLEAIQFICDCSRDITAVLQNFSYVLPTGEGHSILVDVVVNKGSHWVKVITRRRDAIHRKWLGEQ